MTSKLIETTEVYRCDTEFEVEEFIKAQKALADEEGFEIKTYKSDIKEKKAKGEVIAFGYKVTIKKVYAPFFGGGDE